MSDLLFDQGGVVWSREKNRGLTAAEIVERIAEMEAQRDAQAAEIERLEADLAHEKAEHAETVDDYQNACRLHEKAKVQLDALREAAEPFMEPAMDANPYTRDRIRREQRKKLRTAIAKALGQGGGGE